MWFELGGVQVAVESALDFSQSYELVEGSADVTLMSGRTVRQVWYRKLRTTLSFTGWWPAGLDGLDFRAPLTLLCAAPRQIQSPTVTVTLPPDRRTDAGYTPQGYAIVRGQSRQVGGGDLVPTPLTLAGDVATLTAVDGAIGYEVAYWPALTVFAHVDSMDSDIGGATHRRTLTATTVERWPWQA